jgi:hypothetical protein
MELFKASRQWAQRPDDERFSTLEELHGVCISYRGKAAESTAPYADLEVVSDGPEVKLAGREQTALFSHWAFGQLSQRVGAPPSYLRALPASLAATCLNHGLKARVAESNGDNAALMFHRNNGDLLLRAVTSDLYTRIWNADITGRLLGLGDGWRVPPARPCRDGQAGARPATEADLLRRDGFSLSINVGDLIAPAGLYASDHDMFAFMVNEDRRISDGTAEGLSRGFFCWNSEVGASSFGIMTFLYRNVCGNHIVWGASGVNELRIRHVGNADDKAFGALQGELVRYADSSASDEEAKIEAAKRYELGQTKDEVLDKVFGFRLASLSREKIGQGYELAAAHADLDGSPRSAWGLAQGLTRLSQTLPYADARVALDRAAGKVLQIAF